MNAPQDDFEIPAPPPQSNEPDDSTKTRLPDYTSDTAEGRTVRINLWFFQYGTVDRVHGAAIFVFLLLFFLLVVFLVVGWFGVKSPLAEDIFGWLTAALWLVIGVVIGRNPIK